MAGYNEPPFKYAHITASGGNQRLKTGVGVLHTMVVNNPGTTNTITISDGTNTVGMMAAGTIPTNIVHDIGYGTSLIVIHQLHVILLFHIVD